MKEKLKGQDSENKIRRKIGAGERLVQKARVLFLSYLSIKAIWAAINIGHSIGDFR
jgi:hypothetical protein